jgi:hypothetical protein
MLQDNRRSLGNLLIGLILIYKGYRTARGRSPIGCGEWEARSQKPKIGE